MNLSRMRVMSWVANKECPPKLKKRSPAAIAFQSVPSCVRGDNQNWHAKPLYSTWHQVAAIAQII
ncbi:hypothetical protein I8752_27680 [Nostocaceae cyanobacterium CENA369]|uniref:Uncharacterized protein n=1 Tax=Dendronalium phyllosphericum CENA369 TaxID=1725256 RepID=A0A8J7LI27_9NOST|nr:hypothetical protein [Dendronalium phyllosphericum]MBH8576703.1 hypothetical protein [Dendronalium phyllosphericum CENA369]